MSTIAGHTFAPNERGELVCVCGRSKLDVLSAHKEDIGQNGWAHSGNLTQTEYEEIDRERERLWRVGIGAASTR